MNSERLALLVFARIAQDITPAVETFAAQLSAEVAAKQPNLRPIQRNSLNGQMQHAVETHAAELAVKWLRQPPADETPKAPASKLAKYFDNFPA